MAARPADFTVEDHGSVVLIRPVAEWVREWIADNVYCPSYFGTALVCEPRYAADLISALLERGAE